MAVMLKDFKGGFGGQELDLKAGDKIKDENLILHLKRFGVIREEEQDKKDNKPKGKKK